MSQYISDIYLTRVVTQSTAGMNSALRTLQNNMKKADRYRHINMFQL